MIKFGQLNTTQFSAILKDFDLKLPKRDVRILFRHLDKDNMGLIDYAKFYRILKFKPSVKKIDVVRNTILTQLGPDKTEIILNREPDPSMVFLFSKFLYLFFS